MNSSDQINVHETTLRDYLRVLFRQKFVIVTTVVTVCATVFIGLKLKTPVYESRVKMLITAEKQVEATYYKEMYEGRNVQQTLTQSEIVKSNPVINRVVRALALDQRPLDDEKRFSSPLKAMLIDYNVKAFQQKMEGVPEEQRQAFFFRRAAESLKANIAVEPIRDTNMFTISVKDHDPVGAAIIANVISRSYVIFDLEQQLSELKLKYGGKHPTVNLIEDSITELNKTLSGQPVGDIEAIGPASVKVMEQASVAMEPAGAPKVLTMVLAVVMSVFLAVMLAFVFEYTDQSFKSPEDVERGLGIPFLGGVLQKAKPAGYQNVSEQIYLLMKDKKIQTLLMTSFKAGEGVTTVTHNIGKYIAANLGQKVLMIDANPRHLSGTKKDKTPAGPGLFEVLEGKAEFSKAIKSKGDGLFFLPAGNTGLNPGILLVTHKMADVLKEAKTKYDLVIIDADSISASKDALELAAAAEATVLIISAGRARRQAAKTALDTLKERKAVILGGILNNRVFSIPKFVYERV